MTVVESLARALAPLLEMPEQLADIKARLARIEEAMRPKPVAAPGGEPEDLLTTEEAAHVAGVTPATVREWIRTGRLRAYKAPGGRHLRMRRDDLFAHLNGASGDAHDIDVLAARVIAKGR